jgi:hypothetical protein
MSKEAMKLALEAFDSMIGRKPERVEQAITALKEALAKQALQALHDENERLGLYEQEQGEPVAWMDIDEKGAASGLRYWSEPDNRHEVALYTK